MPSTTERGLFSVQQSDPNALAKAEEISFSELVASVRSVFDTNRTKDLQWRKKQLLAIREMLLDHHEEFAGAVVADLGGPKHRGALELADATEVLNIIDKLDQWAAPHSVPHNAVLGKSYLRYEPKGVVLVIAPWNYPLAMILDPLIAIIAAGNCAILKPSEVSRNTCAVIAKYLPQYLDTDCIKVVTGGVPETTALLREKFDHIFYTGNGAVARIIMKAAAENLTPLTLELGGKSPVYVDKSANLDLTVKRINSTKWLNYGQTCVAPDYIMVHEDVFVQFKEILLKNVPAYAKDVTGSVGKVINANHVGRVSAMVKSTTGEVIFGGDDLSTPTVVLEPSLDDQLLTEEIFGPVLPIKKVSGVEEAAELVNKVCKTPLALYIFSNTQKTIDYFLDHTQSGGVSVNTAVEHLTNPQLPFGGVGDSGFGRYHGKWGFDEFSHIRSVYVKDTLIDRSALIPPPPYNQDMMYNLLFRLSVKGLVTPNQKRALKVAVGASVGVLGAYFLKSKL